MRDGSIPTLCYSGDDNVVRLFALACVALAALSAACGESPRTPASAPTGVGDDFGLTGANPFGVMLPARLARSPEGMKVARELGVAYLRPESVFLEPPDRAACPTCDIARQAGLELVLTVRANGPSATSPPADLTAFEHALGAALDRYRPAVLVVENEENSALFYAGTPSEYLAELAAACRVAHERGIPCANGGLVSALVVLLVYDHYRSTQGVAASEAFADRAFTPEQRNVLGSPEAEAQIGKGKQLLAGYRAAGADYVNFHWYQPDARALGEAVTFLRTSTGLPVISNEMGQFTDDPAQTTAVLDAAVRAGLPLVVWFGLDGPKARGLVNPDGTLRPTGEAFKRFVRDAVRPGGG